MGKNTRLLLCTSIVFISVVGLIYMLNTQKQEEIMSMQVQKIVPLIETEQNIIVSYEYDTPLTTEPTWEMFYEQATLVVKASVQEVAQQAYYIDPVNTPSPLTAITIQVQQVLKGDTNTEIDTVYFTGGRVSIADVLKSSQIDVLVNSAAMNVQPSEQSTTYVAYTTPYDVELVPGKEYIFMLEKQASGVYLVLLNGYGVFEEQYQKYENVLTKEHISYEISE